MSGHAGCVLQLRIVEGIAIVLGFFVRTRMEGMYVPRETDPQCNTRTARSPAKQRTPGGRRSASDDQVSDQYNVFLERENREGRVIVGGMALGE